MGCDIHSIGQVRIKGKWETKIQDVAGDECDYNIFAILANVRNGTGFAGIPTGEGYTNYFEPRGLPHDLAPALDEDGNYSDECIAIPKGTRSDNSYEWAQEEYRVSRLKELLESERVWMGDHSHSWLLLPELEEFIETNSHRDYRKVGVVDKDTYEKFIASGRKQPDEWCGMISGPKVLVWSEQEYKRMKNSVEMEHASYTNKHGELVKFSDAEIHIRIEWKAEYVPEGLKKIVESLRRLAKDHNVSANDVRYVFGFDS